MGLGHSARTVLGNHDLSLLALAHGARRAKRGDTMQEVLAAPDRDALLDWLRQQPLAMQEHGCLIVHAGVLPQWTAAQTLVLAQEVEAVLRSNALHAFLQEMYGNTPAAWDDTLTGTARLRVIVNALTRLRFCTPEGVMDFESSAGLQDTPVGLVPWFDAPGRQTKGNTVAFGHWSQLGLLMRPDLLSLDTGCVWGGCLSACRWHADPAQREIIQVHCEQSQAPGMGE
jgi:bis(5'-nucleosyl)-tetraphosphatase (symmetrical)